MGAGSSGAFFIPQAFSNVYYPAASRNGSAMLMHFLDRRGG